MLGSFVGPWSWSPYGDVQNLFEYLPTTLEGERPVWPTAVLVAFLVLPVMCLAALLRPKSLPLLVAYRALTAVLVVTHFVLLLRLVWPNAWPAGLALDWLMDRWGPTLFFAAMVLALLADFLPERPASDTYTDVFQ